MIAWGVWPETGRQEVLAWRLADSEDTESRLTFLSQLAEQGLRGENGWELIIHDGGRGWCAALTTSHFDATAQRCRFHKLRNIWQAIRVAEDLPLAARKRQRRTSYRDFGAIFQAKPRSTVLRRTLKGVQQDRHSPPEAVATLRPDFARDRGLRPPSGTASNLAPQLPAHHQSPRTLQSPPAAAYPQRQRLPLRYRRLGDDRPGGGSDRPATSAVQAMDVSYQLNPCTKSKDFSPSPMGAPRPG